MSVLENLIQEILDAPKDDDILDVIQNRGIAHRSLTSDVLMDMNVLLKHSSMNEDDKKALELRICFLVRYIMGLEHKLFSGTD